MEMIYLHSDDATRPSLTCDGLVCIPVPGSVNVLIPLTGEILRFPSGPDPVINPYKNFTTGFIWHVSFPAYWVMGFGKDKVNGNYKIVRIFYDPEYFCEILDLGIGEWRRLSIKPPHRVDARRKSAYVNGSIYWLEFTRRDGVLILDLHTEKFRSILTPKMMGVTDQLVNLEDRLALTRSNWCNEWKLEILILDDQEETWNMIYSINLIHFSYRPMNEVVFTPLALSKNGNLYLCDSRRRLFKYYPERNLVRRIGEDICVVSSLVENFTSLRQSTPRSESVRGRNKWKIPKILLTTTLVYLVVFRYFVVSARSSSRY